VRVEKDISASAAMVEDWCNRVDDTNPLHLDEEAASDSEFFDERIVPGILLLDEVSGLITQWAATKEGTAVISRLSSISFDEPVYLDETVQIAVEDEQALDDGAYILSFEVTDSQSTDPRAYGSATVYLLDE
jgi:acyl dehydratase